MTTLDVVAAAPSGARALADPYLVTAAWPGRVASLWTFLVTGVAIVLTRIPFATQIPFNWDSAQFMLAMRDYDVTRFQPHPPGYAAYVGLANAVNWVVRDEHTALILISVVGSILASWAVFMLGARLGGLLTGWVASAMLIGSVTYWAYGGVALTYVTLTFWATSIAALAWGVRYDRKPWLPVIAVLWALACGFRGELLIFLAPVVLFATWGQPWRRIGLSALLFVATALAWFVPMAILSGGLAAYVDVFVQYVQRDVIDLYSATCDRCGDGVVGPSGGVLSNLRDVAYFNYYALGNGLVALAALAGVWWVGWGWREERRILIYALLTVAPMLAFYGLIHIGDQGYIFSTYGQILALTAVALVAIGKAAARRWPAWGMAAVLAVVAIGLTVNAWSFLFRDTMVSRIGLARHDAVVRNQVDYARRTPADQRLLLGADHYRHLVYYFPENPPVPAPNAGTFWSDRFNGVGIQVPARPVDRTLYVVDADMIALVAAAGGQVVPLPEGEIGVLPVPAGKQLNYGVNNRLLEVVDPPR